MDSVGGAIGARQVRPEQTGQTGIEERLRRCCPLLLVNCNCDPRRRATTKRKVSRVSSSSSSSSSFTFGLSILGNCPKLHLYLGLLCFLCLIAAAKSVRGQQLAANQSQQQQQQPIIIRAETEPSAKGCLPLIGDGGRCQPTQTEATTTTTAAASSGTATTTTTTMRYESLKVNPSEAVEAAAAAATGQQRAGQQQSTKEVSPMTSAGELLLSNASKPQQRQARPLGGQNGGNLNVLCNSRCNCVILDLSSKPARPRLVVTPDTSKQPPPPTSSSSSSSAGSAAPGTGGPSGPAASASVGSGSSADQANQALIAFNEDYSLDYEQPQVEQQPQQQQQILSAPNPSNAAQTSPVEQAARQTQLQRSPQVSGQHQQQQQLSQPSTGVNSNTNNNNLQLFNLQHHLQAGSGGAGKASSAQLYAQSLYSSQAPKLSYHAHAPYSSSSSSSPSSKHSQSSNSNSYLSQNLQSAGPSSLSPSTIYSSASDGGAPPGGSQTNHHQHYHPHHGGGGGGTNSMRSNYHINSQRHHPSIQTGRQPPSIGCDQTPDCDANDQFSIRQRVQVQALLPLQTLNASDLNQIKQISSIVVDNSSSSWELPESFLIGLENLLTKIEQDQIQSLILSRNNIEFEYWTELYALLAANFRKSLYHLDLSHNSIVKLGITFTGYLEHHLVAHNGIWLQQQATSNPNPSQANTTTSQNDIFANNAKAILGQHHHHQQQQQQQQQKSRKVNPHSLFNGGKLYTQIQAILTKLSNSSQEKTNATAANQELQLLAQPMLIRALDLSHNKLKWLINDQFKALKHVQTIRLDHNRIRYIHQHAFSGLESLRFLNLNHNRLQVIYIEQFQTNYNLLALMLRSNYLAYLRGGSFASLSQLKRLDLSQNKLTILSNNAFIGLESLELLNVSSNEFVHVPSGSFHPFASLKKLDLSNNLLTELAPGTFFHLAIEELLLNQNDQLVTIERGALWDLPYLSKLYLNSNPMLMNINSQSFVSTQNLQFIDIEGCQSLDANARQLLENITMTATSRQLRLEQQQQLAGSTTAPPSAQAPKSSMLTATLEPVTPPKNLTDSSSSDSPSSSSSSLLSSAAATLTRQELDPQTTMQQQQHKSSMAKRPQQSKNLTKYLYYLGTITLLIVALKLVFKYTSTSHYLESRRRRRRVYELDSPAAAGQQDGSSAAVTGLTNRKHSISSVHSASQISSSSQSASSSECDSIFVCGDGSATNQFELYESANNVIIQQQHPQSLARDDDGDSEGQQQTNEQEAEEAGGREAGLGISVINVSPSVNPSTLCCPDCDSGQNHLQSPLEMSTDQSAAISGGGTSECCPSEVPPAQSPQQQQPLEPLSDSNEPAAQSPSIDLIHSQLIAAGFDYGHANCAHFYQSLGPAMQLADMTANFVNNMDYY